MYFVYNILWELGTNVHEKLVVCKSLEIDDKCFTKVIHVV